MSANTIDPITFEVIQNGLGSIVDEMALTVMRTAYSGIVKDALDYSTAFCDRHGEMIAQGLTIVVHLGSFPTAVQHILVKFAGRIYPDDVFILNDPYGSGGIHLPDIYVIKPVFVDGDLKGFSCALAQAVPDRVPADGEGGNTILSMGGSGPLGEPWVYVDFVAGARGGGPRADGCEGVPHPASNIANTPVEVVEIESPVRIESYELVTDSGGAGKYRGALGQVREVRCLAPDSVVQIRSDKRRFPPYPLAGGQPGTPSWNILNPGSSEVILPTLTMTPVRRDDLVRHVMAGGGGWGNPLERDPELVRADVWNEKVSLEHAREAYGVAIDPESLDIDRAETERLRSERKGP